MARPTKYTEKLAAQICELIADGASVRAVCASEDMPAKSTVFRWLTENKSFQDQYTRAKEAQVEVLADEILEIADDGSNDWMVRYTNGGGDAPGWTLNGEHVQRSRLRLDSRKWLLSKMAPKKYGERIQQDHTHSVSFVDEIAALPNVAAPAAD